MKNALIALLLILTAAVPALAAPRASAGHYRVELTTDPPVIPVGKAKLLLTVTDASGRPLEGVTVRAIAEMPGMKMGEREEKGEPVRAGVYRVPAAFPMGGAYVVTVTLDGPHGSARVTLDVTTGQDTSPAASSGASPLLLGLGLAVLVALVGWRAWKTGTRLPRLERGVVLGLVLLAVMAAISTWAVKNLRRPGAMTPIEAQVMEMNMPAPPGTKGVELAVVKRGDVSRTVRYTGQAVGFVEQDVYPRVTGSITWMPFYAGDRVRAGQVLARLDTSQVEPQVAERRAGERMAERGVDVADAELRQAQAGVELAHSEESALRSAVDAARAAIEDAQAGVRSAEADRDYWRAQIERDRALLSQGALSTEELQREQAEATRAEAAVRQARARLQQARAEVRRTESEMASHVAHVRESRAGVEAGRRRLEQARAGSEQARAMTRAAETLLDYTEIKAQTDGVVTERLISPGVLVNPGQAILKVARIDPIRLQANVAERDLASIRTGAPVTVSDATGRKVEARVSSVAPALDPAARTARVEVVLANKSGRFLPGAYVVMDIATERSPAALYVPSRAIARRARPAEGAVSLEETAWLMVARKVADDRWEVQRVQVETGVEDGERTAIRKGLREGDMVVAAGGDYLKNGDAVHPLNPPTGAPALTMVRITERGYEPDRLQLQAGESKVTFVLETDRTCGDVLVFPALGIRKKLPLNVPVTVELRPEKAGELAFTCGMNMLHGTVIVR